MTNIQFNAHVRFGFSVSRQLSGELARLKTTRPLFVTDKGVIAAGVFGLATRGVANADSLPVFSDVPINPTEQAALMGALQYRQQHCNAIVGIGGGAALDLAKAVAILARNEPPLWQYSNRHENPAAIVDPPPVILLPTTAGTGSEVGRSAVIVFDNGIKAGVRCPDIVTLAMCDPELTLSLPPRITATTGMDALSHCIETFCSPAINPPADAIALDGMKRIFASLERAVGDGSQREARWNMMMGSLEGALCFQKGLGSVHALSHPLGALGFHHGTLNAILLPHVLACNSGQLAEKLPIILQQSSQTSGDLPGVINRLNRSIGIPERLRDLGVDERSLAGVAERATQDNAHKTNPRTLSVSDYESILRAAY